MLTYKHLSIYMGGFVGPLGGLAVLALFPVLKDDFGVGIDLIQLSIPVFMLPFAFFQLFSGTISDRIGRGSIALSGFAIYFVGSILCAMSPDLAIFLGGRFVQGLGFAFVSPVLNALIGDITERKHMGTAMGIFGSSITLGIAVGPLIAGLLEAIDWRLAFYIFAVLSIVEIFLLLGSFGIKFCYQKCETKGPPVEKSMGRVVGDRNVVLLCAAGFLAFFGYIGPQTYMADIYSVVFDPKEIGYILSSSGFVGIFWSPVAGRLVDRIGRISVGVWGFAILCVSLLLLAYATSFWAFIGIFGLMGLGTATIWASLMTLAVEVIPNLKGTVASVFNSSRFFGYALAPPLLLGIYLSYSVFLVYAVGSICVLCGLVALRSIRPRGFARL